jgi:hypothetical protein
MQIVPGMTSAERIGTGYRLSMPYGIDYLYP